MKKFTLLLLFLFISVSGYSQLFGNTEGFEGFPAPTGALPQTWTLGTGNWGVFERNSNPIEGTDESWGINPFATGIQYQGTNCASVSREQIQQGNTSEDFLATSTISVPATGVTELRFWTRMFTSGNQGTIYKVMVAPAIFPQTDPNSYTDLQQWSELDLIVPTSNFNIWTEKVVDLSAFAGNDVYIAFVRVYTQPTGAQDGDRWLIDNVAVNTQCTTPAPAAATAITSTTASLTWTNPSGSSTWEIEVVLGTGAPTGVPTYPAYSGALPFIATGLLPNTAYKYYVRAICSSGFSSPWSVASPIFTTQIAPPVCGGNLVDSGGIAGNYSNNENVTTTVNPVTPGELVTVTFTTFNTQAGSDFLRIYDGPDATFPLLATLSGTTLPPSYTSSAVSGALTFVFISNGTTVAAGYTANISCGPAPACRIPTAIVSSSITTTTVSLNWTQPPNPNTSVASTWDIIALPCGSAAPNATSIPTVNDLTIAPPYVLSGLTPATCYDIYVRAVCGTSNSGWSTVATSITTLVAPPICGGNFVDSGGTTGNYGNNAVNLTTVICPTVISGPDAVTVTFTAFDTQAATDILTVFDGDTNTATLLASLSGTTLPPSFTSSHPTGCLTFVFNSNATTNAAGWLANVTCAPKPGCTAPTVLTTPTFTHNTATFGWTQPANPDTSVSLAWQVVALPCGSPVPVGTPTTGVFFNNVTSNPFTLTGLTPLTCYDIYVRSACGSTWSGPRTITTLAAPPECGGNFVDAGGTTAAYAANSNLQTIICPTTLGDVVTVTFNSFDTEATFDGLYVYNGSGIVPANIIASANGAGAVPGGIAGSYWGTAIPGPFTSTAADGCLTFVFRSDGSVQNAGWLASITCTPPPTCRRPTTITTNTVTSNSAILNWVQPTNPNGSVASTWQIVALPCASPAPVGDPTTGLIFNNVTSNPFTLTGLSPATCYTIYIRAICSTTDASTWANAANVTTLVAPPVCGGNFVDAGGTGANYAANSNVTTIICPTNPGEVVTVTFTAFDTEATWDGLYVYNGTGIVPANIIASANGAANVPGGIPGSYWGNAIPGPFTSSAADGCLTFVFRSDGAVQNPGWVANVTCAPPPTCRRPATITTTTVTSNSAILNWVQPTNPNGSVASTWQIVALPCASPAPVGNPTTGLIFNNVTSNPFTLTGLSPATCYTIYIRAICSTTDASTWANAANITTLVAPPVCGGNFVDAGGTGANYAANSNVTTIICPTNPGEIVTVTFTAFDTEATWDGLYVYDGTGIVPANIIASANGAANVPGGIPGSYWGNAIPGPFTSTAADGCLTFVFRSDGAVQNPGWVANVTCSPAPTCLRPSTITATPITQTSAVLNWVQLPNPNGSTATAWEVLVLPAGSPVPTGPGIPVTSLPYNVNTLTPGTAYVFYVRAICSSSDASQWSAFNFATLPLNDECVNATFAIVNQNLNCVQTTPGTLAGATASLPATTCGGAGAANDDVWFTFTATTVTHVISFTNVTPATALSYAIYQGTCTGLTEVGCNTGAGLVAGTTYYIRVFSTGTVPVFTNFNLCIGTLPCTEAPAFCTGQTVTYANATNVPSLGQIGCLFTSPNPAFFFLQVNQAGPLSYLISQVTNAGVGIDVDYVAWGPFTDLNSACTGVPANPLAQTVPIPTPLTGCPGTLHACSYSIAPQEIMCIPNAQLCDVYVIMITNFSNQAGTVTFTQTNTGGGTTACFPINTFNYSQTNYCQNQPNPTPVLAPGASAGTYTSTPGLVIDPVTGTIDLLASIPGPYVITSTSATTIGGTCNTIPFITTSRTVIITAPASATIAYSVASFCNNITTAQGVTRTGTSGGTYSATPAGLLLNAITGEILPVASAPGLYTVTYTIPATGGCAIFTTTTQVEIINAPIPTFTQVDPICPGDPLADLPTVSSGAFPGITGTWSPAINNLATTTYTFTPDAGQCARLATMTISVGSTTPTFTQVAPICPGATLAELPTTSNAPDFITGVWSPAINNLQTTTYTFTPTSGTCVGTATMTIQVLPNTIVPTFTPVAPICPNGTLAALPTTSNLPNSISGSWSPALDNTVTTTYTFTPNTGQCALPTTLQVIVNPELQVSVNSPTFCQGSSATVTASPAIPGNYNYAWTVPAGVTDPGNVASFPTTVVGTYTVVISQINTFCNNDFETPVATGTTPNLIPDAQVPCWNTTAADGVIEYWPSGFEGVAPYSGNNLVELNANTPGTLFQDFNVVPGTSISVSFAHRGRQGTDVVGVEVGPVGGPYVSLGNFSDGNTAWGFYTVNYTIPAGSNTNYRLRFVSVSSTGGNPSIGNLLDAISISSLSCPSQPSSGVVSLQALPAPTVTVIDPTCAVPTGIITVDSPLNPTTGALPVNLFISEVTDAPQGLGSLSYVEIYNGTGAAIDLSNYKLKTYNNGSATVNPSCDNTLSGILNNNSTVVVAVGSNANQGGIIPNIVFSGCTGVNDNDNFRLTTSADVEIDLWGRTDGNSFTPSGQAGYTYRRLATATVPSLVWNEADWTVLDDVSDVVDYSNVGTYSYFTSNYEYSLDGGAFQSSNTFSGPLVTPGVHTITVRDLVTGCLSLPFTVTVGNIVNQITPTFSFGTALTICSGDTVPNLPTLSDNAVAGTWSPLVIDNANSGTYTFTPDAGQCASTTTLTVTVTPQTTPTFSFGTSLTICSGEAVPSLPNGSDNAIPGTWSPLVIDNANSGTYTFTPDAGQCATTTTLTVTVTPRTTPTFSFGTSLTICTGDTAPTLITTSDNTIPGTWFPTTVDNANSGTYTFTPDVGQCATTTTLTVTVTPQTTPTFSFGTSLTICSGDAVPVLPNASNNSINGTWSPTTVDNANNGTYTFTPNAGQCATTASLSVTVTPRTTPTFSFGTSLTICSGDAVPTLPNVSSNSINGTWSPAVINTLNTGTYTFTPGTSECAVPTTFTVTVTPRTTPTFSFGTALTICSGAAVPVLASTSDNTIPGTWVPALVNNLTSGTYTFTPDAGQCATTTTLSVTVTSPILVELSGGCQSVQYILTATPLSGSFDPLTATYLWQNALGVDVGTNQSLVVPEAGSYTVTVTSNGCSIVSIPFVVESVACQIQKGISVNNDGLNDTFDLTGFDVKKLIIFNRLGMQVYSRSNYINEWGGKSDDGDELPDGTYFYNIEQRSGEVRTGWIYINRAQ